MTKAELKEILKIYSKIRNAVKNGDEYAVVKRYRSEQRIRIPPWIKTLERSINEICENENALVREILEYSYIKGHKDREVIMRFPVSESGYYRIKQYIEEKIYELCIAYGKVSVDEVMQNKI